MKFLRIILLSLLLALMGVPAVVALASDISDALFFGVIRITNADTEATNVATTANISTTNLINGGYLNASANNSVIRNSSGADIAFMPGYTPDDGVWSMFVPTIGDNSLLSYILYTADSSGGKIRYFPDDAGMATTDDASLELGDNFTIEHKGYVDTDAGADKNLVLKEGAFRTYVSGATNIISEVTPDTFPTIAAVNGGNNATNNVNHTVNLPAGIVAGNLLLVFFASDSVDAVTFPGGWTELYDAQDGTHRHVGKYRVADGGEGATIVVTTTNPQMSAHTTYRVTDYTGTPEVSARGTGNSVVPDPPSLTPSWGLKTTLWFAVTSYDLGTITVNTYPAGYGNTRNDRANHAEGVGLGNARKEDPVATEDPGVFTISAIENWQAYTVAVVRDSPVSITATGVASGEITVTTEANGLFFGIGVDQTNSDSWPIVDDLVLNAPLYHTGLDGSPFTTKDVNEHTTTVSNAVWSSAGRVFDGTNDVISVAADATIEDIFDGGGTVIMWINPDNGGEGGNARFFDHSNNGAVGWYLRGEAEAAGKLKLRMFFPFSGDDRNQVTDSTELTLNTWSHVAATYNSDNTINVPILYVNTIPVTLSSATPTGTRESNTGIDLLLGDSVASIASINGTMGEVRFYSDILTPAEILDDYNRTRWKFDGSASYPEYELVGTGVLDNANNWAFLENDSMPYMESHEITIGGTQAQFIEWEYAATFTDQSANSNDATPTFRTDSSDADVTAELVSFQPVAEAKAPGFVLTDPNPFLTPDTGNITSGFTTTPPTGTFPLAPVIVAIANATSTPPQLPLLIIAAFVILAASMSVSAIIRRHGSGSIIIKIITIIAVMGVFVALRNFGVDFWMIVIFLIISIALAMGSKQLGWT